MGVRAVAAAFGVVFGFMISWGQFTDPDEIRQMLLLEDAYLWQMFALAVAIGFLGVRLARRAGRRALVTGERISFQTLRPERHHVVGAALFGLGWSISTSCPAPITAQLAQGVWWSAFTITGIVIGVAVFLRRQARVSSTAEAGPDTPRLDRPASAQA